MLEVGQLPVIGQADATRIDIPGGAQASHLLRVGMPTGEQRCIVATQELPYHVIWRLGENDLVERTRRSMKTEQVLPGFQRDLESRAKLLDKGDIAFRELRERPGPDLSLIPARLFTCRRLLARGSHARCAGQPGARLDGFASCPERSLASVGASPLTHTRPWPGSSTFELPCHLADPLLRPLPYLL